MRKLYFFASVLLIACGSQKLAPTTNPVVTESTSGITKVDFAKEENVAKTLKFLASDDNEGRDSGSKGIEKASVFLENMMKENGIKPYFKTYRDTLSNFDKPAYNIVGYIEGNDSKLKNEFVIIGAHYDHIGKIAAVNGDDIANGANDNASGSTAVTEVMKYFAKNKKNKRSLIFVFFSAEEKGLLGSKHLAKKLKAANLDLYIMFNFEMIGVPMQNKDFILYLTGFGKTNMASKMNEYAGEKVIGYVPAETKYQLFRASDNYPFFTEFDVPAQTVSTFDFENFDFYHKPDDEFELMDPKHMTNVVNTMIPVLEIMMNKPTKEITINVK
ncbi:M20/M25/M40 family metallo-hydrolase [uncultured Flavobacterium sp.]|uniref:M28 family metallopeptidase n=1 Tax=uncultured Flavobacterium sp. TaxID=165435 RepID=UPI0030EF6829|tara:strand:+ start:1990 stop:2976 length:987 start_codon:yes stop_codon:yes gene_type:complete